MTKCKICQQEDLLPGDKQSGICETCMARITLAIPAITKRLDKLESESLTALQTGKIKRFGEVERQLIGVAGELAAFERLGVHTPGYASKLLIDTHTKYHDQQLLMIFCAELEKCQADFEDGLGQLEPQKFDTAARRALQRALILEFNTLDPKLIAAVREEVAAILAGPPAGYEAMSAALRALTSRLTTQAATA